MQFQEDMPTADRVGLFTWNWSRQFSRYCYSSTALTSITQHTVYDSCIAVKLSTVTLEYISHKRENASMMLRRREGRGNFGSGLERWNNFASSIVIDEEWEQNIQPVYRPAVQYTQCKCRKYNLKRHSFL